MSKDNTKSPIINHTVENFRITEEDIQLIREVPILDIVEKYIPLTKNGAGYKAPCPFHEEKTPSFTVNPSRGKFHCFGCHAGGDGISFVMKKQGMEFTQACREIAKVHNISIHEKPLTEQETAEQKKKEGIFVVNTWAQKWFTEQLHKSENTPALDYLKSRWNVESIQNFSIGFAPDGWYNLMNAAKDAGYTKELLKDAGLVSTSEKEGKISYFDCFRNRIIFPIQNRSGRICGFSARAFGTVTENTAKYLNTRETEVYKKGSILYGFHSAYRSIKDHNNVFLVEGIGDVIRLHQFGINNAVASCGTALSLDQINDLKKVTTSITLIGDSDVSKKEKADSQKKRDKEVKKVEYPGQKATKINAENIIKSGIYCKVILLPGVNCFNFEEQADSNVTPVDDQQKHDPDSFFSSKDQFEKFQQENGQDYIIGLTYSKNKAKLDQPRQAILVETVSELVACLPKSYHLRYIEQLSSIIKPKKLWQDSIKNLLTEQTPKDDDDNNIPKNISLSDFEKYGFYEEKNCYYFKTPSGIRRGSNFVMEPLFHIASVLNAKRLYKISNEFGLSKVIELQQRDLTSLSSFRLRIESLGNFLFEGSEFDLMKLKRSLYEKTLSAYEIVQLGWQKQGFWAWSNGIFNESFQKTDEYGIVSFNNVNFYLPSSSDIYKSEDNLFVAERKFYFTQGTISLHDYSKKLIDVFGDNAMFCLCFYFASLFRDHIAGLFGFFPILNLFGPKGSGKTELAIRLLHFFGPQAKGPNIVNTTRPALADHVAMFSNGFCHIDEYSNSLEIEKIEFLKGLWDGTGRTRMNMDKDRKKETTRVDCGIILSGQHMPTADIALFSRLAFLSFSQTEFSDPEKLRFNELQEIEALGLCHITHELLHYRKQFISTFTENYQAAAEDLNKEIGDVVIEDRIFRNWLVMITSFRTLKELLHVPWSYEQLLQATAKNVIRQNQETKKSNELSVFWSIFEFLVSDEQLKQDIDFKIELIDSLKTDKVNVEWKAHKHVLMLNHTRIFQLYLVHGGKSHENIIPRKTLEYYLMNCKEYLGKKHAVGFHVEENRRIVEDVDVPATSFNGASTRKVRKITDAMCFDFIPLNLSLAKHTTTESDKMPF